MCSTNRNWPIRIEYVNELCKNIQYLTLLIKARSFFGSGVFLKLLHHFLFICVFDCLPSSLIQRDILQLCHLQISDICWNLFGLWYFFFHFKMAFGWELVIESGPNMSRLSQCSWGAGLVSMQVSLVLCVGVSDKVALPSYRTALMSVLADRHIDGFLSVQWLLAPTAARAEVMRILLLNIYIYSIKQMPLSRVIQRMLCCFCLKHTIMLIH